MILENKITIGRPRARLKITKGQKFGRLTTLCDVGGDKRGRLWECLCGCGKTVIVSAGNLKGTKSCGCLRRELVSERFSLPKGEANLNYIIRRYKVNAKSRNIEFLLTRKQFIKLIQKNCWYCGIKPCVSADHLDCNGKFAHNGIDRVDNEKGYTVDNCVTCCGTCNRMKNTHTQRDFLAKIELIHNHMLKVQNA